MAGLFRKSTALFLAAALIGGCAGNDKEEGITETIQHAAAEAQKKSDYPSAALHYRNLHQKHPEDLGVLLELAKALRYGGAAGEAVKVMEAKWKSFAELTPYLLELSKAKLAAGMASDAIGYLKIAIEKDSGNWEAYSAMGISYDVLQQYDKAMEAYRIANELSPNNPVILNNMAISAAQQGKIKMAIATLKQASKISRKNPQIRQNLALFHGIKGDFDEAEAISKMDLDEETVRNNLAFYYLFHKKKKSTPAKRPLR